MDHHVHDDADIRTEAGLVVLGVGAGELVARALELGAPRVYAWEPDPWILRCVLGHHDWSADLQSGRLRLALGADLLRLDRHLERWKHPVLAQLYARELEAFDHSGERVLVVDGGLVVEDLVRALAREGFGSWTLFAERDSPDELARTVRTVGARRLYSINYVEGLTEFAEELGLELFVWEIDAATAAPRPLSIVPERTRVFCHRRANEDLWRRAGYPRVEYLPLAADPERRRPLESVDATYRAPMVFVGSSLVANADGCATRFLRGLTEGHGLHSDLAEEVLRELVEHQVAHPERFDLPEVWATSPFGEGKDAFGGEDPVMLVAEVAASRARLDDARALVGQGLTVWGDEGWRRVSRLDTRGPAGHRYELSRVYAGADLVLDLPRLYQRDIVTMRVFDALAMGRPVLTPQSASLAELFHPGEEVLTYANRVMMTQIARGVADHDLAKIAQRGRDRVLREHTFDHRLRAMHRATQRAAA